MSVLREINSTQRKAWQLEWPFTVELLSLDWLFADQRYQREVIPTFVQSKIATFDPTLVGTLDVSMRSEDSFAILDGLQRSNICEGVDKKAAWCAVYRGMSIADEARHFSDKNRERRNMHPFYVLRARRTAGDVAAKDIFAMVADCDYKLSPSNTKKEGDTIVAVTALEEVYNMESFVRPEGALPRTLETVRAGMFGREGALEGTILRGVGRFWRAYGDDEVDFSHLVGALEATGPRKILGYAQDRVTTSRNPKAVLVAEEIVRLYNRQQRKGGKLSMQFLSKPRLAAAA